MEIILSKKCESFTGSLGGRFGYHIQHRKNGFFSKRNSNGPVPRDGHWLFIVSCAQLAQLKLHVADIRVTGYEMNDALKDACLFASAQLVDVDEIYNADDVLNFVKEHGL